MLLMWNVRETQGTTAAWPLLGHCPERKSSFKYSRAARKAFSPYLNTYSGRESTGTFDELLQGLIIAASNMFTICADGIWHSFGLVCLGSC